MGTFEEKYMMPLLYTLAAIYVVSQIVMSIWGSPHGR